LGALWPTPCRREFGLRGAPPAAFPRLCNRDLPGKDAQNDPVLLAAGISGGPADRPPPVLTSCPYNRSARNLDRGQGPPDEATVALVHTMAPRAETDIAPLRTTATSDPVTGAVPRAVWSTRGTWGCVSPGTTCNSYGVDAPSASSYIVTVGLLAEACTFVFAAAMISSAITRSLTSPVWEVRTRNCRRDLRPARSVPSEFR
jgi:hypothetical protein